MVLTGQVFISHTSDMAEFPPGRSFVLAGRQPFIAPTPEALLLIQAEAAPVLLRSIRPDLRAGLCGLVEDLMAKDPAVRPASAVQPLSRTRAISAPCRPQPALPGSGWRG